MLLLLVYLLLLYFYLFCLALHGLRTRAVVLDSSLAAVVDKDLEMEHVEMELRLDHGTSSMKTNVDLEPKGLNNMRIVQHMVEDEHGKVIVTIIYF